jgi:hypothetical protein
LGYWALHFFRRRWAEHRLLLLVAVASLPLGYAAVELGWMVTELGRQPWILYHIMTVPQAFTTSPFVPQMFATFLSLYVLLSVATFYVLTRYFREHPLPNIIGTAPAVCSAEPDQPEMPTAPESEPETDERQEQERTARPPRPARREPRVPSRTGRTPSRREIPRRERTAERERVR